MDDIQKLINFLEESVCQSEKLQIEGENELQDFSSLVESIRDGLNEFEQLNN